MSYGHTKNASTIELHAFRLAPTRDHHEVRDFQHSARARHHARRVCATSEPSNGAQPGPANPPEAPGNVGPLYSIAKHARRLVMHNLDKKQSTKHHQQDQLEPCAS